MKPQYPRIQSRVFCFHWVGATRKAQREPTGQLRGSGLGALCTNAALLSHNLKADRNGPWSAVRAFARHGGQSEAHAARALPASCLSWPPTQAGRLELGTL